MSDEIADAFEGTFGNYEVPGVPASGARQVRKSEARALGRLLQDELDEIASTASAGLVGGYTTLAGLNADLAHPEGTLAKVAGDGANDGVYRKSGASGAGSWAAFDDPVIGAVETAMTTLEPLLPTQGFKLVEGSGAGVPAVYTPKALTSGSDYVWEVTAAAGERGRLSLVAAGGTIDVRASFNLDAATAQMISAVGVTAAASIMLMGNGEYRCRLEFTPAGADSANFQHWISEGDPGSYTGDGASGLYVQSPSLKEDGVELFTQPDLTDAAWTKSHMTVQADAREFGSIPDRLASVFAAQPLAGLKWAAIGTSITDQDFYTSVLAATSGMALTNLGVSGGSIAENDHYGSLDIYDTIASIPADTELVTIEAGTNDFGAGATAAENSALGQLGDTTTATFYGALYAAVVAIKAQAPNAKIVFLTPYSASSALPAYAIGTTNPAGNTLPQFQKAVEEVAAYTGWPLIDVGRRAGIGYFTADDLTSDGLHLDAAGGAVYAAFVYDELKRLHAAGFFA